MDEVQKNGDEVRESLMKREHIGVRRLVETRAHSVQQGMGHLMRYDVVRQAGVDGATRKYANAGRGVGREKTEPQLTARWIVVGVPLLGVVRAELQHPGVEAPRQITAE